LEDDDINAWSFSKRAEEQKHLRREKIEDVMSTFNKDLAFMVWVLAKPIEDGYCKNKPSFVKRLNAMANAEWFEQSIIFIIVLSTIIIVIVFSLVYPHQSKTWNMAQKHSIIVSLHCLLLNWL